ncbi:branched-chain amino acid ABC transporter permease [Frigoribacterium faeni]|uniref:branched-chain amino acid ABC transporter permease n=1 Tax=Frigoribacterium faeni TaxID=145483 RepID=UPI0032650BA9|nr:branched-chain amino acid transport system permease protein [Frigoribacterium faeni]
MKPDTTIAPRALRPALIVTVLALLLGLAGSFVSVMAAPAAAHASGGATASCAADPSTGCIQGSIRTSEGEPATGVVLDVTGPGGFEQTAEVDGTGRWALPVTEAGQYTVTLDTDSLPDGQFLTNAEQDERMVNATLGANAGVIFQLSETEGATTGGAQASSFSWDRAAQQFASGIRLGLLLALAAIGLSLIYGTTGLSSFSHGEQVTLGGLLAYVFANQLGMNIFVAATLTVVICAATGFLQDAAIWKPLRRKGLSLTQLMIVTIGLSIALQYAFQYFFGAATVRIQTANPTTVTFAGITLTVQSYVAMGISVVVLVLTGLFLTKTRTGRATRAVSDNPALAAASGIDVDRIIRLVWTLAAGLAGLSGVMLGLVLNGVNWMTGLQILLLMFAAVTLGGLGTSFGALVGSLIIGVIVELTNLVLPGDFKYATALLILIVILLFRPQGIFGRAERIG